MFNIPRYNAPVSPTFNPYAFPGGNTGNASTTRLEAAAAIITAVVELFNTWLQSRQKQSQTLLEELEHFKDESRWLRHELDKERSIRLGIEEALREQGFEVSCSDGEDEEAED